MEERLQALEDRASITELLASYGPLADAGNGAGIGELWDSAGTYTFDSTTLERSEVGGLVELESHRQLMQAGCAHVLGSPTIRIEGDGATAVNHSVVLVHRDGVWVAERVSANRWELVRTESGWKVANRTNRLLTGVEEARALLKH
ncbi:nuclear transport factor 2 family protein [Arthrobacter sp. NPDC055585]